MRPFRLSVVNAIPFPVFLFLLILLKHTASCANEQKIHYLVISDIAVPFQVNEGRTSSHGIITDVVTELLRNSEYTLAPIVASNKRIDKLISEHQAHPWIGYDAPVWNSTAPYGEMIDVPLFEVRHSYLTCDTSQKSIRSDDDLRGKTIAILASFTYPELTAIERTHQLTLIPVKSYQQGFILVSRGRADGFIEMDVRLRYNLAAIRSPGEKVQECFRFIDMSQIIAPYSIHLAVDRDMDVPAKALLRTRLLDMKNNGSISQIVDRYTSSFLPEALTR